MILWSLFVISCVSAFSNPVGMVTLSYMGDPTTMGVTWITMAPIRSTSTPMIYYGEHGAALSRSSKVTVTGWTDTGSRKERRYTYRGVMTGLTPDKKYDYKVGSEDDWSSVFNFRAVDPTWQYKVAIFGDLSLKNGYSVQPLIDGARKGYFDMVVHIGDIAYDMDDDNGDVGDDYMNALQEVSSHIPYMVIGGNHEAAQNFSHLANRYSMPSNHIIADNQFWSFTIGNAHFVGLSSEYYGEHVPNMAQKQYQWVKDDLQKSKAAWNILFMHRPMYCSDQSKDGCKGWDSTIMQKGDKDYPALEPLFNSGGADLVFWGHQHSYERSWPVRNYQPIPQKDSQHYHNSPTPVYIMTGAAGCHSHMVPEQKIKQPFTAAMSGKYGYTILTVVSSSQVTTELIDAKEPSHSYDKFYLTKDPGFRPGH